MGFMSGEEVVVTLAPVAVYWVYAGIYEALLRHTTVLDRYRLHSRREEETKNIASRKDVVRGVLLQQAIQVAISVAVLKVSTQCTRAQLSIVVVTFSKAKAIYSMIELARSVAVSFLLACRFFLRVCMHGLGSLTKKGACVFPRYDHMIDLAST